MRRMTINMEENVKLAPPWETFYNNIKAFFGKDSEIKITIDEDDYTVKMYVDNQRKADALTKLLPEEKVFGNITVKVKVIPANKEETYGDLFIEAFRGNRVLKYVSSGDTPFGNFEYIVFNDDVVQYYNDNMMDVNGNRTTLYQEIAPEVFDAPANVHFCTKDKGEF